MALSCEARALHDRTLPRSPEAPAVGPCVNEATVCAERPTRSDWEALDGPVEEFAVCGTHRQEYDRWVAESGAARKARAAGTRLTVPRWRDVE